MGVFINKDETLESHVTLTQNIKENVESSFINTLSKFDEKGFEILEALNVASYIYEVDGYEEIITEGFSDFLSGAANFFKELLIKIGKFFKDVLSYLSSFITTFDSFIERNKDKLMRSGKVKVKGYKYTLDKEIPNVSIIHSLVNEFNADITRMEELSFTDIRSKMESYNQNDGSDTIRAAIVGANAALSQEDLNDYLKKLFRNDEENPQMMEMDNGDIINIVSGYKDFKKEVKKIKKDQQEIERAIGTLQSFFERGYRMQMNGGAKVHVAYKIDKNEKDRYERGEQIIVADKSDNIKKMNLYYSFRFSQMKDLSNSVLRTASAKTQAYKESLRFQEQVLRKAIFGGEKDEDTE